MSDPSPRDALDENLRRLLKATAGSRPEFAGRLSDAVLAEVRATGRKRRRQRWLWGAGAAAAVAAACVAVAALRPLPPEPSPLGRAPLQNANMAADGRVTPRFGLVSAGSQDDSWMLEAAQSIRAGQWIQTHWGSEATILLGEGSEIALRPRTRVEIPGASARVMVVRQGAVRVAAVHQPPGQSIVLKTPGAAITVLGTHLEVRVVKRPDGRSETRVNVASGKVEIESGGSRALVLPNMEATVIEGEPPVVRSTLAELDVLANLWERNQRLAAEQGLAAGQPAIVQFGTGSSATVWQIVHVAPPSGSQATARRLPVADSAINVVAYTLSGASLAVQRRDDGWWVELPDAKEDEAAQRVVVKLAGVEGLFAKVNGQSFDFDVADDGTGTISLVQLWLPGTARFETATPAPIEIRRTLDRLAITVAARSRLQRLFD